MDHIDKSYYLLDITPEFKYQIMILKDYVNKYTPKGIFITHAHSGHYTGLIELGKEVMNTKNIPIHVMPKMYEFLYTNNPWKNLSTQNNIKLKLIKSGCLYELNKDLFIKPFSVNHRNEISETVGFNIYGNQNSIIFLPDIDDWNSFPLEDVIKSNDYLFLDGTFYDENEIFNRDLSKIPHPFISDTIKFLDKLNYKDKKKINFIHLNHTNDALRENSMIHKRIIQKGFGIANEGQIVRI